ncbi:hypothetical protein BU26DRAFT_255701 [Trematosphaeria pertusa]|uniref:Uncharacterized protein n=1 Tax=Trematosphaeria pertusa TaxID=390896 RepID=A0A6A6IPD8_9PLEO|nr:uncharacterized protein BU26DRAFT_255701 [Trematosphaeria pertusa]KAF2252341.1 hypothetical protein BU26DRAFT_255701 [Trematosphaeria pertusa]
MNSPEMRSSIARSIRKRGSTDLSFLDMGSYELYEMHFSLTIVGRDESRWDAYAFEHREPDDEFGQTIDELAEDPDIMMEDPVIGSVEEESCDANHPIWSPRNYYIRVTEMRSKQVLKEWTHLIRKLERTIKIRHHPHALFCQSCVNPQPAETESSKLALEWSSQTLDLLQRLRIPLKRTIHHWNRFSASDGDISYLLDLCREELRLENIRENFEALIDLEQDLAALEDYCSGKQHSVLQTVHLLHAMHETSKEKHRSAELTVLLISPVALASAFFSIPSPVFSFERNSTTFVVAVFVIFLILALYFPLTRVLVGFKQWSNWKRGVLRWVWERKAGRWMLIRVARRLGRSIRVPEELLDEKQAPALPFAA